eukprot:COSAG02_NODE_589_length_19902_cov_119.928939_13_plen_71_part_00
MYYDTVGRRELIHATWSASQRTMESIPGLVSGGSELGLLPAEDEEDEDERLMSVLVHEEEAEQRTDKRWG